MANVTVDQDKCIGCGTCQVIAPKTFKLKGRKMQAINPPGDDEKTIQEALDSCPVEAIKFTN